VRHLLVTNDFPPKMGGIQSYLWELWRRLPASDVTVLTTPHPDAAAFDAQQAFRIERTRQQVLWPTPALTTKVRALAGEVGAELIVLDPALPLGLVGPSLGLPYAVIGHGAEVTVPGRIPGGRTALAHVLRQAALVIAAGGYPAAEASRAVGQRRMPPVAVVPCGVDSTRFHPLAAADRKTARQRLGLPIEGRLIVGVSRLVPRKGFDVLIDATARLATTRPDLHLAIGGAGRDSARLQRRIDSTRAPATLLGRVPEEQLPELYACADVFAMPCRANRWGGLEQEGFGIVFLEAAAAGVTQVAGDSGGAAEAVVDGVTGIVVHQPNDADAVASALAELLDDPDRRRRQGEAARRRAETEFSYDHLTTRLAAALEQAATATPAP
jgi:phosphatidyl-myo-inositol dimannoside synthase